MFKALYIWDEVLGHHIWFVGLLLGWSVVAYAATTPPPSKVSCFGAFAAAGVGALHGTWLFMGAVEGQCVSLVASFVVLLITGWLWSRINPFAFRRDALRAYWTTAVVSCTTLLVAYGAWQGWDFPEFRVLGLGSFSRWPGQILRALQVWWATLW